MDLADSDMPGLLPKLDALAKKNNYGKIFAKVPNRWSKHFENDIFRTEALIPGFFRGEEDGHFMGKYLDPARADDPYQTEAQKILELANTSAGDTGTGKDLPPDYSLRRCTHDDCAAMANLYGAIFPSYPFPVNDKQFLAETMAEHVIYFGLWHKNGELAALASAERYQHQGHVEMTDFLTVPHHRRQGLAGRLLAKMDKELGDMGMPLAYTIARALSSGMNITFAKAGYKHAGTLTNNTQICGRIESMQVWYKSLAHEFSDNLPQIPNCPATK